MPKHLFPEGIRLRAEEGGMSPLDAVPPETARRSRDGTGCARARRDAASVAPAAGSRRRDGGAWRVMAVFRRSGREASGRRVNRGRLRATAASAIARMREGRP